jgi:hypothetical protein
LSSKVGNDFKQAFALLLSIAKINFTTSTALNYSQLLYEWTLAGLITDGKVTQECTCEGCTLTDTDPNKKLASSFNYARKKYMDAIDLVQHQATAGRKEWIQSEILGKCFDINQAIMPIALAEGLLDLKDIAAGIGAGAAGIPTERDR